MAGFTDHILANRPEPGTGKTLEEALSARRTGWLGEEPDDTPDPDDRTAAMVTRGYRPGRLRQLSEQLADVSAELQAEKEKLEKGIQRAAQVRQLHEAGRVTAWQIPDMLGDDLGDEARVRQLERKAETLRAQLGEATDMATPPPAQRAEDPVEAAASRAHQVFVEVTRQMLADAEAGRPRRERRPFAGRGGLAVRAEEVTCPDCLAVGADAEESFLIHHSDADGNPLSAPQDVPVTVPGDDADRAGPLWNPGQELRRGNLAGAR
jgi:hypothetical protein